MTSLLLKQSREKSVLRHHPWIFSGAIEHIDGDPAVGETIEVYDNSGKWLARGAYSPFSQIAIRIWTWNQNEEINQEFINNRIRKAVNTRNFVMRENTNAYRLVHGESDGLPGLIVDLYDKVVVIQFLSAGTEYWKDSIILGLRNTLGDVFLYERSDADVRSLEGLPLKVGSLDNRPTPTEVLIKEHDLQYKINIKSGQKTGFYLDQRDNRFFVQRLSNGKDILDCFCYTGGFSQNALVGGARSILAVDESEDALSLFEENLRINRSNSDNVSLIKGDVFQLLRRYRDSQQSFDLIIMDPPKFAPTVAQVDRASRGYKDINLLAMKLLRQDGILVTFSCSGGVSSDLFTKIISGASLDSGNDFQILTQLHQSADHPIATNFPEGAYLKGLVLKRT